jgi:hypothetical protein
VELKVYLDASGQPWYDVPGYGRVNWPVEEITLYARSVVALHRPDGPVVTVRLLWRVLPALVVPHRDCKVCLGSWVCREARWASSWLDAMEHGWRSIAEAEL